MMTKQEHIDFWKNNSDENYHTAIYNLNGKQYVFTLFLFHLTIEKLLKAHWIKDNIINTPPFTHDLKNIYSQTDLDLEITQIDFLALVSDWNISTRYPDYKNSLFRKASQEYVLEQKKQIDLLRQCLLEKL